MLNKMKLFLCSREALSPRDRNRLPPNRRVMISTALSGGTLSAHLEEAVFRFGAEHILLRLERAIMDFPLPAPTGQGRPLSPTELNRLIVQRSPVVFFSPALYANYFYFQNPGQSARFILFDNAHTLRKKLELARSFGIDAALVHHPQVADLWNEIRGWEEISSQPL